MRPAQWRPEMLCGLPSQNQTPAFLRRQKSEPQRSNEKIQWVLLVAKKRSQGAKAGSRWLTEAGSRPQRCLSPLPALGTGHVRFKTPGPKG